jgi:hypothetical protein
MAARNARIRAAITQWPTPVATIIKPIQTNSTIKENRPCVERLTNRVNSKKIPITKPETLIIESVLVTIDPASSLALGSANDRNTPKAAGATATLKNTAAPSHSESTISREMFRMVISSSLRNKSPTSCLLVRIK